MKRIYHDLYESTQEVMIKHQRSISQAYIATEVKEQTLVELTDVEYEKVCEIIYQTYLNCDDKDLNETIDEVLSNIKVYGLEKVKVEYNV